MPKAARISDYHTCPAVNPGPVPHVGGPVSSGSPDVNIGYIPAARVGDTAVCVPAVDSISAGSANVFINHRKAARIGDGTSHGGKVVVGCATVNIGETPQSFALLTAAKSGAPFCEECERAKRKNAELRAPAPSKERPADAAVPTDPPASPVDSQKPEIAAKQPNAPVDDGFNQARNQAREKVAWDFLSSQGMSAPDIESHLGNIDITQPVEIVTLPEVDAGPKSPQPTGFGPPGVGLGPYLCISTNMTPAALGMSPKGSLMQGNLPSGPVMELQPQTPSLGAPQTGASQAAAAPAAAAQAAPVEALKSVSAHSGEVQFLLPSAS